MAAKEMDVLKGKMEQIKSGVKEIFSTMENRMESRFGGSEEILKKLIEMQSKTPPAIPIANPHHDLIEILLAKSKRKEIRRKDFGEKISFHQEPPPIAQIRGGIGFSIGGRAGRKIYGRGGKVTDHYGRPFGQGEWTTREGGGRAEPWGSDHERRLEEMWDPHPQYTRKIRKDHNNRYTGGEASYWCGGDLRMIEEEKSESSISETQAAFEDKLIEKEKHVNKACKEINLQSQADGINQNLSPVQSDSAETSTSQEPVFS
ncbi:hypothetical protein IEQ34_019293 [Dendrobium chrysotoxum]|uniref:Uncharacterized protein n=1 Tax=Dendrobium chrysotoxum TaxID=161865 RepID=A0AAV7FR07_DENCH|nr:hypothetical protein IEQ34_019293 [Dendrobium chrysotoxum]